MALAPDVQRWIEQQTGGRIVEIEQQARWRPHHFVTLERDGESLTILARSGRGELEIRGSRLMRHFDLAHEARVIEALQGHDLAVPRFYGYSAEHDVLLMERLAGTNELATAPDDVTRRQVMFEYYEQLARLHGLDIESMKLEGIEIPSSPEEVAFAGKFRFSELDYLENRPRLRPEPLLDLGVWWLHANVPQGERPLSFLQGDTGPGQFMFDDGHLTGLIDWELAHIGDPMLDLGVARMRNMLYPTGSLREPIEHYAAVSGRAIDWPTLCFYTVFSTLLTPLSMAASIQRKSAKIATLPRFGWDVTLRRGMCDALAEVVGVTIEPPELPTPPDDLPRTLLDFLTQHLELHCLPIAHDDVERFQIESAVAVAHTLQLESSIGDTLLADDLDDMGAVLGRRPRDRAEGFALLADLVATDADARLAELVPMFGRIERRRELLWRPMMIAQSSGEFEPLAPVAGAS